MQEEKLMKLKEQLKKLKSATPICKICFKPVDEVKRSSICSGCFNKFEGLYETMNVEGVKLYSIYEYNDFIRQLIYQLKGCFDIEIAQVFLKRQRCYLKIKYLNYVLVHVPSSKEDDERRGFNHVREIFKSLNLKSLNVLIKKENFKQSELKSEDRKKVFDKIELINKEQIFNKKILLVDDIITTGSTIKACIKKLKEGKPKDIKVLVLARKCRKKSE